MFRSKRTSLLKRLWKQRVTEHEASCPSQSSQDIDLKSVLNSMLKRLKEGQLEVLSQAVETKGADKTPCVLLPKEDIRSGRLTAPPHFLCCQVWRWPDLDPSQQLKKLPCCTAGDQTQVCCNPYHWSRLYAPDCPPPSYTEALQERVKPLEDPEASVVSTETGGTPSELRLTYITGDTLSSGGHGMHWCHIAYWELRQRVGRLFSVFKETVNIFQELPHGDGMCLGVLQRETPASDSVKRTRNKVGIGVTLSKEGDGVWLYNRSEYPVFVNSPTLDPPCVRTLMVHKVLPGYAVKMFDYDLSHLLEQTRRPMSDGPYNPNSIQISFAKGWGPSYSRQFITSCPCWIEVLLNVKR